MSAVHLTDYLETSATRFPERVAVVDPDGTALTYRELNERAKRIAGFLAKQGVCAGDRVGLVLPKNTAALTAVFGVMKAGAAYVPVDWTGPAERIRTILKDCQVRALFLDSSRPELADTAETVIWLSRDKNTSPEEPIFSWDITLQHAPVAIDSDATVAAAAAAGIGEVVVDVNVGMPRCGCAPGEAGRIAEAARARRTGQRPSKI